MCAGVVSAGLVMSVYWVFLLFAAALVSLLVGFIGTYAYAIALTAKVLFIVFFLLTIASVALVGPGSKLR